MSRSPVKIKHGIVASVEAKLLREIRMRNGVSRMDLARILNLAPSTAGIYVDRLVRKGFLVEAEAPERTHGRQPTLLFPNPSAGRFVGVDLEAHTLMTMVVDFTLQSISRSIQPITKGDSAESTLEKIHAAVRTAMKGDSTPLLGVGVGVPGVVDASRGTVSKYEFIRGWHDIPVAALLAKKFDVPVHVENNIRCMALAELWLGQGRGLNDFLCLGVRTGTNAVIVIGGEIYAGSRGAAGEIGGLPVSGISLPSSRSNSQTVETAFSLDTLLQAASSAVNKKVDWIGLRSAIEVGDRQMLKVLERTAALHGAAIRQLFYILDPERIILVGPLAELGAAYLVPLTTAAGLRTGGTAPIIVNSSFGQFGGALGAAALALQRWKPTHR